MNLRVIAFVIVGNSEKVPYKIVTSSGFPRGGLQHIALAISPQKIHDIEKNNPGGGGVAYVAPL